MNPPRLRTAVVGFGMVASGLSNDSKMGRYFSSASHAQALKARDYFAWDTVVDPRSEAQSNARSKWGISYVSAELGEVFEPEAVDLAVIATPPDTREQVLHAFPNLRAVMVEKPLGVGLGQAKQFVETCGTRNIIAQVNFWRRGVPYFHALAQGGLEENVGEIQAVFATYGNGLHNNALHLVDFCDLLFGPIAEVIAVGPCTKLANSPVEDDVQVAFSLQTQSGVLISIQPLNFGIYREIGLDVWGEQARLTLTQESLSATFYPRVEHRALEGAFEIASDQGRHETVDVSQGFANLYDNLVGALHGNEELLSGAATALRAERVIDAVLLSARKGGMWVPTLPHE